MRNVLILDIGVVDTVDELGSSTNIWLRPYRRKSGKWMIYINNDRQCNIGISEACPLEKLSINERKMLLLWLDYLDENDTIPFTGRYEAHAEGKTHLAFGIDLYVTECGCVGGQKVAENGCYLVRFNKLFKA